MIENRLNPILYPPTIIGHITEDISDLFRGKIANKKSIKILYGCQLNGPPHLGTTISLMCAYALGKSFQNKFQLSTELVFGALENAPGEKVEVEGIVYQRMLCDTYKNGRTMSDIHLDPFKSLLSHLSSLSGIPHSVEFYKDLQVKPVARKTLLELIARESEFISLLNPSDDRLRVRFRCPECNYEEKHSKTLRVIEHEPLKRIILQSTCFQHDDYKITITEDNYDFVDVNTMVRNVMKEVALVEESQREISFPLIVKGADWMHANVLISNALELLGYSFIQRPERISAPMLEDWSGAKFSKSVYIKSGTYDLLPKEFVSLEGFMERFGENGFKELWEHVSSWVSDPKKFYRNYSLDYLKEVFGRQYDAE